MDNLETFEKIEGGIKNGQSRNVWENRRGNQEWTIQKRLRKSKGQSRMDNLETFEKTEGTIKNGQFRNVQEYRNKRTKYNTNPLTFSVPDKWLTMFYKTRGRFSVIFHRSPEMRVDWETSSSFKKHL